MSAGTVVKPARRKKGLSLLGSQRLVWQFKYSVCASTSRFRDARRQQDSLCGRSTSRTPPVSKEDALHHQRSALLMVRKEPLGSDTTKGLRDNQHLLQAFLGLINRF